MLSISEFLGRVESLAKENEMVLLELDSLEILIRIDRDTYHIKRNALSLRMQAIRAEQVILSKAWGELKAVAR